MFHPWVRDVASVLPKYARWMATLVGASHIYSPYPSPPLVMASLMSSERRTNMFLAVQHLFSASRLPFTAAYFGSIALTLYFSIGVRSSSQPCSRIPAIVPVAIPCGFVSMRTQNHSGASGRGKLLSSVLEPRGSPSARPWVPGFYFF
jgi:hypothetical protein